MTAVSVLVLAKAPVPGLAKTRLCPPLRPEQAAEVAAAALLDTLAAAVGAARALGSGPPVVALAGAVTSGARADLVAAALARCQVVGQRGDGLGERIAAAHADLARLRPAHGVVQVGMDTPQAAAADLVAAADVLRDNEAGLGAAEDGGWWVLALRRPLAAAAVVDVPMSRADTHRRTRSALRRAGLEPAALPVLRDLDTWEDARAVAAAAPRSVVAATVAAIARGL